jgi:hypothetical protein
MLDGVRSGAVHPDEAVARLRRLPFADLGFARVDHHRALRQGFPEVVYGPGKTPDQCAAIVAELLEHSSGPVLVTRASPAQRDAVVHARPHTTVTATPDATHLLVPRAAPRRLDDRVVVVTAGTADLPVADECAGTLEAFGVKATRIADVGVAGIHRLLAVRDALAEADIVIVVAGMEGALPSAIGGITPAPVVAVPTSVGYGASLAGVTALLSMLASCASGITVVGIDNGFGAACAAIRLLGSRD